MNRAVVTYQAVVRLVRFDVLTQAANSGIGCEVLVEAFALEHVEVRHRDRRRHRSPPKVSRAGSIHPFQNGSAIGRCQACPMGEYPLVMPLAQVIMSGT